MANRSTRLLGSISDVLFAHTEPSAAKQPDTQPPSLPPYPHARQSSNFKETPRRPEASLLLGKPRNGDPHHACRPFPAANLHRVHGSRRLLWGQGPQLLRQRLHPQPRTEAPAEADGEGPVCGNQTRPPAAAAGCTNVPGPGAPEG